MWTLVQGASAYVYPTCTEKGVLTNPYYLINFVNDTTKDERFCICEDVSDFPARNQKLLIEETTTPASATNEVNLDTTGFWKYYIYEQASSTNLDPTGLTEVERGKLLVTTNTPTLSTYEGYQTSLAQYNGQT